MSHEFTGFPPEALHFLADLAANNNKPWFEANKEIYQNAVLAPAQAFVVALGQRVQEIEPALQYDPRPNGQGSLMRIYRDVRFSKDKSPYSTHVSGMFWEGEKKSNHQGAVFGFLLDLEGLRLMDGRWQFSKEELDSYRQAVADDTLGGKLATILTKLQKAGYRIEGEHYKRVPDGYDPNHPRAALLKHAGLYVHPEPIPPPEVGSPDLVDRCVDIFRETLPLHRWLRKALVG